MEEFMRYVKWIAIALILTFIWIGLEYTLDGTIVNQHSDTIMCLLLSYLLVDKINIKLD